MSTPWVDLYISQGIDYSTTINIEDDVTFAAANITGYIVTGELKKSFLSPNVSEQFTCSIANAAAGEILISIPSSNTSNLKSGYYFYDVFAVDTLQGNTTIKIIEGIVEVSPSITGIRI